MTRIARAAAILIGGAIIGGAVTVWGLSYIEIRACEAENGVRCTMQAAPWKGAE